MRVTPHFLVDEFDCHDGTPYPPDRIDSHLRPLCEALEVIRDELAIIARKPVPLAVVSGYRSPRHNERVEGASKSRHVEGDAADIRPMGVTVGELHATALRLHRMGKIRLGGLGLYRTWVHIDVRPGVRLAQWTGKGVGSEDATA